MGGVVGGVDVVAYSLSFDVGGVVVVVVAREFPGSYGGVCIQSFYRSPGPFVTAQYACSIVVGVAVSFQPFASQGVVGGCVSPAGFYEGSSGYVSVFSCLGVCKPGYQVDAVYFYG